MYRFMLKSKLHRATVTQADVDYEGSVTVDRLLLEAADILPHEEVHVWNVTRGSRPRVADCGWQTAERPGPMGCSHHRSVKIIRS